MLKSKLPLLCLVMAATATALCTSPVQPFGYDASSKIEMTLEPGCNFAVKGWKCAPGFSGNAVATSCKLDRTPYVMTGCTADSSTFCKLTTSSSCVGATHEFILDLSGNIFPTIQDLFAQDAERDQKLYVKAGGYHDLAFADIDGDGDVDMILPDTGAYTTSGTGDRADEKVIRRMGRLRFFENVNGSVLSVKLPVAFQERHGEMNPFDDVTDNIASCHDCAPGNTTCESLCDIFITDVDPRVGLIYPFAYLSVAMVDVDDDGDIDGVFGTYSGTILYFENYGTAQIPQYRFITSLRNPFHSIAVLFFSSPAFVDADGDADLDLVVGNAAGTLLYYERTSSNPPVYEARTNPALNPFDSIDVGGRAKPTFVDITGDDALDLVVAAYDGEIFFFANTGSASNPAYTLRKDWGLNPFLSVEPKEYTRAAFFDADQDSN